MYVTHGARNLLHAQAAIGQQVGSLLKPLRNQPFADAREGICRRVSRSIFAMLGSSPPNTHYAAGLGPPRSPLSESDGYP
jgi:hypothetical protein